MNIKRISQEWLDAKQKQADLAKRKLSIYKLIASKEVKKTSLLIQLDSEIYALQETLSAIEAQHQALENNKTIIEFDLLKALEGAQNEK